MISSCLGLQLSGLGLLKLLGLLSFLLCANRHGSASSPCSGTEDQPHSPSRDQPGLQTCTAAPACAMQVSNAARYGDFAGSLSLGCKLCIERADGPLCWWTAPGMAEC